MKSLQYIRDTLAKHNQLALARAAELRPEHDTLAELLRTTDAVSLGEIDAKIPARPKSGPTILTIRSKAIRAALALKVKADVLVTTSCNVSTRKDTKGRNQPTATPAKASAKPSPPAAPALTTARLEALAVEVFGNGALPSLASMDDAQKRAALAREFYMANLKVPGVTDDPALAAKNWWRPAQLTGAHRTIAAYRQARVNAALTLSPEKPRIITRAAFDKLSPVEQSQFCLAGGLLTDN